MPKEQPAFGGPLSLKAGNVNNLYRTLEEYWSDYSKGYFYCPAGCPKSFETDACAYAGNVNVGALGDSVGTDFTASFEEPWIFASFAYRSAIEARCRQHTLALRRPKPTARPC